MRRFLKITLFLLLPLRLLAQVPGQAPPGGVPPTSRATLSGYVKDIASGEALIGVSVYVKERGTGAVTNPYGFYALTLPSGTYTLVFTFVGYEKVTRTVELDGLDQKLDLELREEGRQLAEVVVKSQREDDNVRSVEMSVNKIDMKTIRAMPALLGEVDLVKSLQLLPGVTTVGEGASGFNVRGGDISQNLILLDEAPVYNSSHLFGFFSVFNPDAVKDVKLIKGGIPANYGGRISSILDVRMKEGNAKKPELNAGIGAIFSRVSYERPILRGKGSFILAARRSYIDVLAKPFLSGDLKGSQFYFYDLTAKANYKLDEKNTLFLSGYFGRDVFGSKDFGFDWGNGTVSGRWNHVFSNKLFLNLTGYYSNYKYGLGTKTSATSKDAFDWNSKIVSISAKPDFTFFLTPENQITFGGQYIRYDSQPGAARGTSAGEVRDFSLESRFGDETAFYVANEQKIGSRLTLQYGLRYSYFRALGPGLYYDYQTFQPGYRKAPVVPGTNYKNGEVVAQYGNWEPRFSANLGVSPTASVKVSYNRTTQYLHLLSNTAASSPLDVWTLSSKNIKPQLADQVALGWFQNFGDNALEFSVETYYKDLKNQIDYVRRSDLLLNQFLEGDLLTGRGRAYGAEFYLKKSKGRLTGWVSYTLARTERLVDGINNNGWFPARFDKTHNLTAVALYDLGRKWSVSSNFAFATGTPATYPTNRFEWNGIALPENGLDSRNGSRIPAYHRLDLSATKRIDHGPFSRRGSAEWVFSIYNAYGRRNPFSVFVRQNENDPRLTEAVRYSVFGTILPAVTYNFKF